MKKDFISRHPTTAYLKFKSRLWTSKLFGTPTLDEEAQIIESHGSRQHRLNLELYRANSCVDDEKKWADRVSKYLSQFNLSPITIAEGTGAKFSRLTAAPGYKVTDGPKVSVLIAAFNAAATIKWATDSILNQTWRNLEVIVVDDFSPDETWLQLRELAGRDERVKILRNSINVGPFVSRNRALALASGDYITGHDADDWAHPQRIERQLQSLFDNQGAIAVKTSMLRLTSDGVFRHFDGGRLTENPARSHPISSIFESEAFRQNLGHWDSVRFAADSELWKRAQKVFGKRILKTPLVTNLALVTDANITSQPVHGRHGGKRALSPTRVAYRKYYSTWHKTLQHPLHAYLEFPLDKRKFEAPEVMLVDPAAVRSLLRHKDDRMDA